MVDFMGILDQWENLGVFNILLPFLLVFAITFAVLEKVKLFGQDQRKINGVIAAILGILVVRNQYIVGIINRFLPNVAMFMIIILMFLLLVGIFKGEHTNITGGLLTFAVIVCGIFILWSLSSDIIGARYDVPSFLYGFDDQTKATILFIGIFVGVVAFVMWGGKGGAGDKPPTLDLSSLGGSNN